VISSILLVTQISTVTQMLYPSSRTVINYHWPGPSALECKFVSLIEGRNDDQVDAIRRSSIVPERREDASKFRISESLLSSGSFPLSRLPGQIGSVFNEHNDSSTCSNSAAPTQCCGINPLVESLSLSLSLSLSPRDLRGLREI